MGLPDWVKVSRRKKVMPGVRRIDAPSVEQCSCLMHRARRYEEVQSL